MNMWEHFYPTYPQYPPQRDIYCTPPRRGAYIVPMVAGTIFISRVMRGQVVGFVGIISPVKLKDESIQYWYWATPLSEVMDVA